MATFVSEAFEELKRQVESLGLDEKSKSKLLMEEWRKIREAEAGEKRAERKAAAEERRLQAERQPAAEERRLQAEREGGCKLRWKKKGAEREAEEKRAEREAEERKLLAKREAEERKAVMELERLKLELEAKKLETAAPPKGIAEEVVRRSASVPDAPFGCVQVFY